jgi:hypothetical protein
MTEEFKAARNPAIGIPGVSFVLPVGILQQDFNIIDEQEHHIVRSIGSEIITLCCRRFQRS